MNFDVVMQQLQAMPQWLQIWLAVLAVMNTLSLFFLRHASGRLVFVVWVIIVAVNSWVFMQAGGFTRSMAFIHMLWIPMIVWLGLMPHRDKDTGLLRTWLLLLVLVNCISIGFDVLEIVRWLAGDRGVIGAA
ncbi:MAG: hypothetical protein AAF499_07005 [Pseudomonadota bacterium]